MFTAHCRRYAIARFSILLAEGRAAYSDHRRLIGALYVRYVFLIGALCVRYVFPIGALCVRYVCAIGRPSRTIAPASEKARERTLRAWSGVE